MMVLVLLLSLGCNARQAFELYGYVALANSIPCLTL